MTILYRIKLNEKTNRYEITFQSRLTGTWLPATARTFNTCGEAEVFALEYFE